MSEDTEAQEGSVTGNPENSDETDSKKEKLNRVTEKLKAMGMMPDDNNVETQDKPVKSRRPVLLIVLVVSAIAIAGLSYAFIKTKKQDTATVATEHNTTSPANTPMPTALQAEVSWPKPMSEAQVKQLHEARNIYWQRDYEKAEKHYVQILSEVKDQPDLYGELGNVQFFAGNRSAAVDSYVQAATLLIEQNRFAEVGHAVSVVARFDPVRANELMEKMADRHYAQ